MIASAIEFHSRGWSRSFSGGRVVLRGFRIVRSLGTQVGWVVVTDTDDPVRKLLEEVGKNTKLRHRAQIAEARADRQAKVIEKQNRMLIGVWLRGRLIDDSLFFRFVDVDRCTDADGGLIWVELDRALEELLADHPAFATRPETPDDH